MLHGLQAFRRDHADDPSYQDVGGRVAKEIAVPSPDIARRIEYATPRRLSVNDWLGVLDSGTFALKEQSAENIHQRGAVKMVIL